MENGDPVRLADAYGLPVKAVEAALVYDRRHTELIDTQIARDAAREMGRPVEP